MAKVDEQRARFEFRAVDEAVGRTRFRRKFEKRLRVLRLVDNIGETSGPYNQFVLPWVDKHDIAICTFFPPNISACKGVIMFSGDGSLKGFYQALQRALDAAPQRTSSLLLLAGVYEGTRRGEDAAALYRRILGYAPGHPVAANNLAVIYAADEDRRPEALQLAQQAVEAAPDNPFTRDTLGWVQYRMGAYTAAGRNIEQARTAMPEHPEIAYHLGAVYAKLGKKEQAIQLLREALDAKQKGDWAFDAGQLLEELTP